MRRLEENALHELLVRINRNFVIVLSVLFLFIFLLPRFITNLVVSIPIVLGAFLVSILIVRALLRPLYNLPELYREEGELVKRFREFANKLEKIASGGFRETLSEKEDGIISKVSSVFNSLRENTDKLIKELDSLSEKTLNSSRQLNETIRETSDTMEEVNAALQNLTKETDSLNSNIEEINQGARSVETLVQEGISKIDSMENQMKEIMQAADQTAVIINELNRVTDEIGKIVGVISSIAEQTNLLALNAAIEAAHAGEHGRGFAVVANEVRQLSYQTQDLLKEIKNMINELSERMSKAIAVISSSNRQVAEGERALSEVTNTFGVIADRIQDIANRIENTVRSSREITKGTREISSAAEQQMSVNTRLVDMASNLAEIATRLKDKLAETQVGVYNLEIDLNKFDRELANISEAEKKSLRNELELSNEFVIGVIARLEPVKGHRFLIEGMKILFPKYRNLLCLIVGDGSLENELKQLVKREGLSDRIRFLGYRSDIPKLLSIVDLVVLTSEKEGVPPKIICEALASRKPVVATDTIGSRYLVKDGENGRLVSYGDTKALANAIEFFIKSPEKVKEYGQAGRRVIEGLVK
ncbi:MAG: methyl-accepting chemotaxis protein [bacterium]